MYFATECMYLSDAHKAAVVFGKIRLLFTFLLLKQQSNESLTLTYTESRSG